MDFNSSHVRWAPLFYSVLLALSVIAFWPGYLAVPKSDIGGWTHFHAVTGTLWLAMLIVQPWAIRSGRRALHVGIGRASALLFALVIVGFVGLAHASMQGNHPPGKRSMLTSSTFAWCSRSTSTPGVRPGPRGRRSRASSPRCR